MPTYSYCHRFHSSPERFIDSPIVHHKHISPTTPTVQKLRDAINPQPGDLIEIRHADDEVDAYIVLEDKFLLLTPASRTFYTHLTKEARTLFLKHGGLIGYNCYNSMVLHWEPNPEPAPIYAPKLSTINLANRPNSYMIVAWHAHRSDDPWLWSGEVYPSSTAAFVSLRELVPTIQAVQNSSPHATYQSDKFIYQFVPVTLAFA